MIVVLGLLLLETHQQEKKVYGEYLINAQGEDVVAGIRTPQPLVQIKRMQKETRYRS